MADDSVPPIWVVSLRHSTRRRTFMQEQLDALGLDYQMVDAVNGIEIGTEQLAEVYDAESTRSRIGRDLTPGEIGCALSHLALYRRMLAEGLDHVLILEDDALLQQDTVELVALRNRFPADWGVVLLQYCKGAISLWRRVDIKPGRHLGRFESTP